MNKRVTKKDKSADELGASAHRRQNVRGKTADVIVKLYIQAYLKTPPYAADVPIACEPSPSSLCRVNTTKNTTPAKSSVPNTPL